MPRAPLPVGLPSQNHQGVTARFVHRLGTAVRGAFAGIARLRRPAAPPSGSTHSPTPDQDTATPPSRPRRPRPAPAAPARPGWFARCFRLSPRRTAAARRRALADHDPAPFTPENHPGLSPEAYAILNMPVDECPPEILRILLTSLAQHIAASLPPELGLSDPQALFATLWGRLAEPPGEPEPDSAPDAQPDAAAAAPASAEQDAPPPPGNPPEAQAPTFPDRGANAGTTASADTWTATVPPKPDRDRGRPPRHRRPPLLHPSRTRCSGVRRQKTRQTLPPPRRAYNACAGPP